MSYVVTEVHIPQPNLQEHLNEIEHGHKLVQVIYIGYGDRHGILGHQFLIISDNDDCVVCANAL